MKYEIALDTNFLYDAEVICRSVRPGTSGPEKELLRFSRMCGVRSRFLRDSIRRCVTFLKILVKAEIAIVRTPPNTRAEFACLRRDDWVRLYSLAYRGGSPSAPFNRHQKNKLLKQLMREGNFHRILALARDDVDNLADWTIAQSPRGDLDDGDVATELILQSALDSGDAQLLAHALTCGTHCIVSDDDDFRHTTLIEALDRYCEQQELKRPIIVTQRDFRGHVTQLRRDIAARTLMGARSKFLGHARGIERHAGRRNQPALLVHLCTNTELKVGDTLRVVSLDNIEDDIPVETIVTQKEGRPIHHRAVRLARLKRSGLTRLETNAAGKQSQCAHLSIGIPRSILRNRRQSLARHGDWVFRCS